VTQIRSSIAFKKLASKRFSRVYLARGIPFSPLVFINQKILLPLFFDNELEDVLQTHEEISHFLIPSIGIFKLLLTAPLFFALTDNPLSISGERPDFYF
jgi:hypothetical protein